MAMIPKFIGSGNSDLDQLAKILNDMADDIAALQVAINNHQHTENTNATYAQNATVSKSTYAMTIKTTKQPY